MMPSKPLPYSDAFYSANEYVTALLRFSTTSEHFQMLSGGVHILDFFTSEPGLFHVVFPESWRGFLTRCEPMALLDLLLRTDLDGVSSRGDGEEDDEDDKDETTGERQKKIPPVPDSLLEFIRTVRRLRLDRTYSPKAPPKQAVLPRAVTLGMRTKKVHEVTQFAGYIDHLVSTIGSATSPSFSSSSSSSSSSSPSSSPRPITHLVDFGSGQNYLGRALASAPYNHRVVAVEGREGNIAGAVRIDVLSGVAALEPVKRNKKLWLRAVADRTPADRPLSDKFRRRLDRLEGLGQTAPDESVDMRPSAELEVTYVEAEGRGYVQYVQGRLEDGDLSAVIPQIKGVYGAEKQQQTSTTTEDADAEPSLLGISIHSCGNLTHHAIRSLVLNPAVRAIAIVGCCYNLATERLGPPDYKLPYLRPSLQPLNGRAVRESERCDPHGFPMSRRMCEYEHERGGGRGVRLNITARMMACQAMDNWSEHDSEGFFTRHFYRAVLQRIFLDRGVVSTVHHDPHDNDDNQPQDNNPANTSTNPIILGSLPKSCYRSFRAYVRGAVRKLCSPHNPEFAAHASAVRACMDETALPDCEIDTYEARYAGRRRELSAAWSLMAFSAQVAEALMVTDRWVFLGEQEGVVERAWVETVFEYAQSPRNLVVVGIKR